MSSSISSRLLGVCVAVAGLVSAPAAQTRQPFSRVTVTTPEPARRPAGIDPRKFGIAVSQLRLTPAR